MDELRRALRVGAGERRRRRVAQCAHRRRRASSGAEEEEEHAAAVKARRSTTSSTGAAAAASPLPRAPRHEFGPGRRAHPPRVPRAAGRVARVVDRRVKRPLRLGEARGARRQRLRHLARRARRQPTHALDAAVVVLRERQRDHAHHVRRVRPRRRRVPPRLGIGRKGERPSRGGDRLLVKAAGAELASERGVSIAERERLRRGARPRRVGSRLALLQRRRRDAAGGRGASAAPAA